MIILAAVLATQSLKIPAGYYSLKDLAAIASAGGVSIEVDPACADDVFCASTAGSTWTSLADALRSDGSLSIAVNGGAWSIKPNPAHAALEVAQAKRYLGALADRVGPTFTDARKRVDAIYALGPSDRPEAINEFHQVKPNEPYSVQLARDHLLNKTLLYSRIAVAAHSLPLLRRWPGESRFEGPLLDFSNLLVHPQAPEEWNNYRFLGFPAGETPEAVAARNATLRKLRADIRCHLDPQTGATTYTFSLISPWSSMSGRVYDKVYRQGLFTEPLSGPGTNPALSLDQILGDQAAKAWRDQAKISTQLLSDSVFGRPTSIPADTCLSDAVLRYAAEQKLNVLYRPSSYFNVQVPSIQDKAFREVFLGAINPSIVSVDAAKRMYERIGVKPGSVWKGLALDPQMAFSRVGGFIVLRDGLSFLEQFSDQGPVISSAIANKEFHQEAVSIDDVVDAVLAMSPNKWRSGATAGAILGYCDPVTFRPYATLLKNSSDFRALLDGLANKRSVSLPLADLSVADRTAFMNSIAQVDHVYVDKQEGRSASVAHGHLKNLDASSFRVTVSASASIKREYTFTLLMDGDRIWTSKVMRMSLGSAGEVVR